MRRLGCLETSEIQKAARFFCRLPGAIQDLVNQVLLMQTQTIRFYTNLLNDHKLITSPASLMPKDSLDP